MNTSNSELSTVQLSRLEFLPFHGESNNRTTPPTVVAIRSHLPVPMSNYNQDVHSIVDRWEVRENKQAVHPAFEQLTSRRNSVGAQPGVSTSKKFSGALWSNNAQSVFFLKKLESFIVNKIVVSMQPMNLGKVIFFAYSDSSVEYRDRTKMAETTFTDGDLDKVYHLSQIGFQYTEDEPCEYRIS